MGLSRRHFIKSSMALAGAHLAFPRLIRAKPAADAVPVVMSSRPGVVQSADIDAALAREMVESGIRTLTGQSSLKSAWQSVFPGLNGASKVLIKPSCLIPSFSTRFETLAAVCESLQSLDLDGSSLPKENIVIYECTWNGQAGINKAYGSVMDQLNVTWNDADSAGWPLTLTINGATHFMTSLVQWADYIVNISIMKTHNDTCGITGILKSHMGSVSSSNTGYEIYSKTHAKSADAVKCLNPMVGEIWAGQNNMLIQKSMLNIVDGLFASWDGTTWGSRAQAWQSFHNQSPGIYLISRDPVAADTAHLDLTNTERTLQGNAAFSLQPDPANFPDSSHILSVEAVGGGSTDYQLMIDDGTTVTKGTPGPGVQSNIKVTPNPAGTSTRIFYYLDRARTVTLDILNPRGRVIRRLQDGSVLPPGFHSFAWNTLDNRSRPVPAGWYGVRMQADKMILRSKILVLK